MSDVEYPSRRQPIIRVFISSTFNDLKQERDALQRDVFPGIEEYCQKNGFQFQAIDLRWGVSGEAGLQHRAMQICFEELRRSQDVSPKPNFLILLGNRYGWRPLPETISRSEYVLLADAAAASVSNQQPLIEGVHGKTALQILNDWYRLDKNVLIPQFWGTNSDCEPLNYFLQPRTQNLNDGLCYTRTQDQPPKDRPEWLAVQEVLWKVINVVFSDKGSGKKPARFEGRFRHTDWQQHLSEVHADENPKRAVPQIVRFQGSATEQEIWCGALSAKDADKHVFAFFRDLDPQQEIRDVEVLRDFFDGQADASRPAIPREEPALSELKRVLRERLGPNALTLSPPAKLSPAVDANGRRTATVSEEHIAQLCNEVRSRLKAIIDEEITSYRDLKKTESREGASEKLAAMTTEREMEIERDAHRRFAEERGSRNDFVGREVLLRAIERYLSNDSQLPFVVYGPSGSGKSALFARAMQDVPAESQAIIRFLGVTPRSSDLRSLLTNLCMEFRKRFPLSTPVSSDIRELSEEFRKQLSQATESQPVVLFLDALDQLAELDNALRLFWIPFGELPTNVKLVVSCLSDRDATDPAGFPFAALQGRRLPPENWQSLDPLHPEEARRLLFDTWLPAAGRTMSESPEQQQRIEKHLRLKAADQHVADEFFRHPLYLKLLFEEIRHWRSNDTNIELPQAVSPRKPIEALLQHFFDRLKQESNHGHLLVSRALGYLAAARRGLKETELLEVLFKDEEFQQHLERQRKLTGHQVPTEPPRIPIAIWSRLRFDLAPYLTERAAPGGTVITFYHRQVAEWVKARFLDEAAWHLDAEPSNNAVDPSDYHPHARLARHFQNPKNFEDQKYFLETLEEQRTRAKRLPPTPRIVNIRMVDELPFQLLQVAKLFGKDDPRSPHWDRIADLFTDIHFLEAKAEAAE